MKTLLSCIMFLITAAGPTYAQQELDLSTLAGSWNYSHMAASALSSAPLTLDWDGSDLTGQTTYQNYKGKTLHDVFQKVQLLDGELVINVSQRGHPVTLKGTLSQDGSFIRGDYHGLMSNGSFLMNRITPETRADISNRYAFSYQALGDTPKTGALDMFCDNSGQLNGWLKLPDQEYHFEIKGTVSPEGVLRFSGRSKSQEMTCQTTVTNDGKFTEGTWSWGNSSGMFTLNEW